MERKIKDPPPHNNHHLPWAILFLVFCEVFTNQVNILHQKNASTQNFDMIYFFEKLNEGGWFILLKLSFLVVEGLNYRVSLAKLYPFNDVPELKEQNISSLKRHGLLLPRYLTI